MDISQTDRHPIDELAEDFVERYRRGERPTIAEYVERYPEWAEKIRALFPTLIVMEKVRPGVSDDAEVRAVRLERVGDYRILREVGRGGMGVVYEAEQISLGRHVALKVPAAQAMLEPRHLERFKREARAAAQLHHTNIVPVYGVGEENGLHYYVMQFIQGQGQDQVLEEVKRLRRIRQHSSVDATPQGAANPATDVAAALLTADFSTSDNKPIAPPPPPMLPRPSTGEGWGEGEPITTTSSDHSSSAAIRLPGQTDSSSTESGWQYWHSVARIGIQVADALAYASHHGILHRDIKPSNLLLDTRGNVWVTDFGLAKATTDEDVTHTGDVVGTLRYMAPERFQGHADVRSDVYALGLTLYELLTLRSAFDESDRHKLIAQVVHETPISPRAINRAIPQDLETIVLKAINRDPAQRYQTPTEIAEDLQRFLDDRPITARRASTLQRGWRWCRRNPTPAALLASLIGALLAGTGISSWQAVRATQAEIAAQTEQEQTKLEQTQTKLERDRANVEKARAEENLKLALELLDETFVFVHLELDKINPDISDDVATRSRRQKGAVARFSEQERKFLGVGLAFYRKFSQSNSADPSLRLEQGKALWRLGFIHTRLAQYPQAEEVYRQGIEVLERLVEEFPEKPTCREQFLSCHYWLGRVLADSGRTGEAEEAFRRTIAAAEKIEARYPTTSGDASLHLWRSHAALRRLLSDASRPQDVEKSFAEELAFWEKWQALVTDLPTKVEERHHVAVRYACLINSLIGNGDRLKHAGKVQAATAQWQKAVSNADRLIQLKPEDPYSWNHRGIAHARLENWDRSIADETKAIEFNPNAGIFWANRAFAQLKIGRNDQARADCAKAAGLAGNDLQTCIALGKIELDLQRWDEAFRYFARVLQANPDDAPALDGVIAACRKLTTVRPENASAWYLLAQAHLSAGNRVEYQRVCAEMLHQFEKTKDPGAVERLLYTCVPTPDALNDMTVLAPIGKAVLINKGNARILGAAYYRAGKYREAIEPLKLGQARAWDHLFLAMAHQKLGETERAQEYFKLATEQLHPNNYAWPECVESEYLRREAEALIKGSEGRR